MRLATWFSPLYAITPEGSDFSLVFCQIESALASGLRLLQYRNKISDITTKKNQADALRNLTRAISCEIDY